LISSMAMRTTSLIGASLMAMVPLSECRTPTLIGSLAWALSPRGKAKPAARPTPAAAVDCRNSRRESSGIDVSFLGEVVLARCDSRTGDGRRCPPVSPRSAVRTPGDSTTSFDQLVGEDGHGHAPIHGRLAESVKGLAFAHPQALHEEPLGALDQLALGQRVAKRLVLAGSLAQLREAGDGQLEGGRQPLRP